jgi:predicted dithiol-disulfide oxidoreductase (DUF899 family)
MPEHRIGTREEWQAARAELANLEADLAKRSEEIAMFGPDYTLGACPGCTSLVDGLGGTIAHLNHRDVTLICFSRAPIDRLTAYKQRMGWQFPYVSTYNTDFPFDFGLALTEEQVEQIPARSVRASQLPQGRIPGLRVEVAQPERGTKGKALPQRERESDKPCESNAKARR